MESGKQKEPSVSSRRSFITKSAAATAAITMGGMITSVVPAYATTNSSSVTDGDIAILKFLAAAELVETDLWQQYCELAVNNPGFRRALRKIDPALVQYICDDRDDERSHANLINGFLTSIGQQPVNLDAFRTLEPSRAEGAEDKDRLTNLKKLTVDTSWYYRYRSHENPDFGATFPQIATIKNHATIPTDFNQNDDDLFGTAQAAAFHFATIEQGGSSLYLSLIPKVTNIDVLRILSSIGPVEVYHFATFHTSLENIVKLNRPGLSFPDLRDNPALSQRVMPEPCDFLQEGLPECSVIRPGTTAKGGAVATATGLVQQGLFTGQSTAFLNAVVALATAADNATRAF